MKTQERTYEDFTIMCDAIPITTNGYIRVKSDGTTEIDINTSSVLTKLIQEAGRWCKSYASDLFVIWNDLASKIEDGSLQSGIRLFGFRESGVDGSAFILSRYQSAVIAKYEYRSIWRLDIRFIKDAASSGNVQIIEMNLYEVNR